MNFKCSVKGLRAHILSSAFGVMLLIVAGGCKENVGVSDEVEREHPDMKKAMLLEDAGDSKAAQNVYESILDRDPTLARAHLALAFLLDKYGEDHVGAIYHYRRYLVLRPYTEKKAMIESHIRSETLNVAGSVFTNQAAILVWMGEVERENKALKTRVANLQAQTTQLRAALAAVRAKYSPVPKP